MSKIVTWCTGLALAGALAGCGQPAVVRAAGSWGQAIEVPGLAALNKSHAHVSEVSCASAGNCAAGGDYAIGGDRQQGFVVSEANGAWGQAIEVPGLGALNAGGDAAVSSVSCASPGNCAAGGFYTDSHGHGQGFVVSEANGAWGQAIEVPGLAALNKGRAEVGSVSCASPGDCAAGGAYQGGDHQQGFVVSETNGAWGQAIEVPGLATLNTGDAQVSEVSCGPAGGCAAGGYYADSHGNQQGFVVSEANGAWGQAIEVPGLAALNKGGSATVSSVSCAPAGSCAAGGSYADRHGVDQGFVVSERNGAWGQAIEVPGLGALNRGLVENSAGVAAVSCASPGNCAAGGSYGQPYSWAFVVSETNGVWGKAISVPGLGALVTGQFAAVFSVSCASPGNCAAGGDYENGSGASQGLVVSEKDGVWGKAIEVPGLGALNAGGDAAVTSVSCAPAGSCAAGGYYSDRSQTPQGFVTQAR